MEIMYHLCSLFAICSFGDCRYFESGFEPGLRADVNLGLEPGALPGREPKYTFARGHDAARQSRIPRLKTLKLRKHTEVTGRSSFAYFAVMGRHILFKCPRLGINVQHWLPATSPENQPNADFYASVVCLACTRLHFIHKETGKLLGED